MKETPRVASFVEASNMLPSALPQFELESLQQSLHELPLAAGFRNAVLLIVAKLRNSRCRYVKSPDADGFVNLQLQTPTTTTTHPEDVFLLEINPRAPDWIISLSKPFIGGPQSNMQLLFVSAQKGGVYNFGDICTTVLQSDQTRQLDDHVIKCANLMKDGEEVLEPRTEQVFGNFLSFFLVISCTSRKEVMLIGREIERRIREHTGGF